MTHEEFIERAEQAIAQYQEGADTAENVVGVIIANVVEFAESQSKEPAKKPFEIIPDHRMDAKPGGPNYKK